MAPTSTATIELEETGQPAQPAPAEQPGAIIDRVWGMNKRSAPNRFGESRHPDTNPAPAARVAEKWNEPRRNLHRLGAAFWCFFVMGANDAVYGVSANALPGCSDAVMWAMNCTDVARRSLWLQLLGIDPICKCCARPSIGKVVQWQLIMCSRVKLESYYNLNHLIVSLVFLSPFVGYVSSAILNNLLHQKLGRRGVGIICGSCHLAAYVVIAAHPPYVALVFAFVLAGFGNGVADAAWNAWVGNLANSSELLGFLHALYGVGGVVSPLIATALVTKAKLEWYSVYYIMVRGSLATWGIKSTWTGPS